MSGTYRTIDGDMLDAICKTLLGSERHVPAVLAANPGLAALGPVYSAGIVITLPDLPAPVAAAQTRIAAELDATCKPAGGALVVQRRGEGKTAAGDTLTPSTIRPQRLSDWSWSWKGRTVYRSAEAEWTETGTGVTHKVKTGSGTPLKKIRHPYATEAEATRAAESALRGAGRAAMEISCTLAGFALDLLGGGTVDLAGLEPELNGEWHLKSVTHRLDGGGLITEFQGEKGKEE